MLRASRVLVVLAGSAFVVVLAVGFGRGAPRRLPEFALGWPAFLYLLRAAAVAYLILGLAGVGYRLWRGDQVQLAQAPGGPGLGLEGTPNSTETATQRLGDDIRELSDRIAELERTVGDLTQRGM